MLSQATFDEISNIVDWWKNYLCIQMPHFAIKKCAKMGQPDKSYTYYVL